MAQKGSAVPQPGMTASPHPLIDDDEFSADQQNNLKDGGKGHEKGGSNTCSSSDSSSPSWKLYDSIGDLAQNGGSLDAIANGDQEVFVLQPESVSLLETSQVFISPEETQKHEFKLPNTKQCGNEAAVDGGGAVVVAVSVSILFKSPMKRGLVPPQSFGQLKGTLYHADSLESGVGFKAPQLQSLNTNESMGRIFIQYKPSNRYVNDMVVIVEASTTDISYSLSISGRIGIHAESAIEAATIATLGIKQKLKCIKQQPTGDLTATLDEIEIMQRELKILRKQILVTKKMLNDCGTSLCQARQDILDGDANDTLSGVERDALFSSVKSLTTEKKNLMDILNYRTKERNMICSEISSLSAKEKNLKKECELLERQYLKDSNDICSAIHACSGPQAASRVALLFEGSQDQAATDCTMVEQHVPYKLGIRELPSSNSENESQIPTTTFREKCGMQLFNASRHTSGSMEVDSMYLKQQPDGLKYKDRQDLERKCKKHSLRSDKKTSSRACGSGGAYGSHRTLSEKLRIATDVENSQNSTNSNRKCKNRVRFLLAEERRAANHSEPFIDCQAIHNMPQRFPTNVSVVALQAEINNILTELLLEKEELYMSSRLSSSIQSKASAYYSSDDSETETPTDIETDVSRNDETTTMVLPKQQYDDAFSNWKPYVDLPRILERQEQLHEEISRLKNIRMGLSPDLKNQNNQKQEDMTSERKIDDYVQVKMALSVLRGGNPRMKISDAIKEMRWEHAELQRHIQLSEADSELRGIIQSNSPIVLCSTHHSFKTQMRRDDAIVAVNSTIKELVKKIVVHEVFDDLLEGMLVGWVFGKRTSETPIAGSVPSLKTCSQLRPGDQQRVSWWLDKNARQRTEAFLEPESAAVPFNDHGTMLEKSYAGPNTAAQERWHAKHEETEKQEQQHQLNNVELSLQYGTIALLLGYLKSTSRLCYEQNSWSDKRCATSKSATPTPERVKMMVENENRLKQQERQLVTLNAARRGNASIHSRKRVEAIEGMRRAHILLRETTRRNQSVRLIQRVLRGYFGRKQTQHRAREASRLKVLTKVWHEAAVFIQRIYRGYLGRCMARELRAELAEFMTSIRVEEAEADIAEFVSRNPITWRPVK